MQSEYPEDVMKLAEEALDDLLCNCKEACGGFDGLRAASISDIARAIMQDRSARQAEGREDNYQERVAAAHHALFHEDPTDVAERVARFFEEAIETCQAFGLDFADAHKLVNYTYDRPVGEPAKEIGAAMLTLASLCVVAGYDLMTCAESDLEKLQRPETIARIRVKRSTRHGRGPLPGFDAAALSRPDGAETERCPICAETLQDDDLCATDIEMGTCHAACLDGSPVVDLDTGEPVEGDADTFLYRETLAPASTDTDSAP